jgi:alkylhydroperoxidase family enzyme
LNQARSKHKLRRQKRESAMPNPLLGRVPVDQLPDDFQRMREASIGVAGDGDRLEVFGHHPALYRWYQSKFYGDFFDNAGGDMLVDRKWKELVRLKLSLTNGCFVCNAHNVPGALAAFFSDAQILELGLFATIVSGWTKLVFAYDLITRECAIDSAARTLTPSQTHAAVI